MNVTRTLGKQRSVFYILFYTYKYNTVMFLLSDNVLIFNDIMVFYIKKDDRIVIVTAQCAKLEYYTMTSYYSTRYFILDTEILVNKILINKIFP